MNGEFRMGFVGGGKGCEWGFLNWNRTRFDRFSTTRVFSNCRCQQVKQIQVGVVHEGEKEYRFLFETVMEKIWV
jgi:hypothetical protein